MDNALQPPPSPEQILALYDELGRPSASKFRLALKRRLNLNVTVEDVQRIVGLQSERQFLAPPPRYNGIFLVPGFTRNGWPT